MCHTLSEWLTSWYQLWTHSGIFSWALCNVFNFNRFFIFQYYWLQSYYCGEQVETKEVWVIALHVRMCLRSALPSLDPQPACFSFTVQVFACILTPLYLSRYSLNSFHPLSLPFPSLLSSPNFLHILLAPPPAQKPTFLIRLEMDATLSSASVFFFYFAGSSLLCCRSFSSHSVFLLRLFTKTHKRARTHRLFIATLCLLSKLVCFQ